MKRLSLIYVFVLLISNISIASIIESVKTGNWTSSNTWKNNISPTANDSVYISIGDTIFINSSSAKCSFLNNSGVVFFKSATNSIKANNTIFQSGTITGNALGTFISNTFNSTGNSIIGKCHLQVSDSIANLDSLDFNNSSGDKFFNQLTNYGLIQNNGNEDISISKKLINYNQFNFSSGEISFGSYGSIHGSISIDELNITDSLIVYDTLTINNKLEGNGHIRNLGVLQLGMTDGNFKIDSLTLTSPNNELHLIRAGNQSIPPISYKKINTLKCLSAGSYSINSPHSIFNLQITNGSQLTINDKQTINSISVGNHSKLISEGLFNLSEIPNILFDSLSYLHLENNQTFLNPIQFGNLEVDANTTLKTEDSLKISGDFTGNGVLEGSLIVEYNGIKPQTIKNIDYETLVYNNSGIDSSIFYGSQSLENLVIIKGGLKIGSHVIQNCNINQEGRLIIGGHSPQFTDTLNTSGELIINSNIATPLFNFIQISPTGLFNNASSADISIDKGISNDGKFIGCLGTACDYYFLQDSSLINGNDSIYIPRLHGKAIINKGILSIAKELKVDTLINNSILILQVDSQNISGHFNFNSNNNTLVFNKDGDQFIPSSFNNMNNIIINNIGSKKLSNNLSVKGDLIINSLSSLKCDSFQITGNFIGNLKIDSLGSIYLGHNFTNKNILFPTNYNKIDLHDSSIVYYSSQSNQTISSLPYYGNLLVDDGAVDSSLKSISGDSLIIKGNLTLLESSLTLAIGSGIINLEGDWNGTGNVSFTSGQFKIAGNGNSDGTLLAGTSEVIYDGKKEQRIKISEYYDLIIDKIGKAHTKANSGFLNVVNETWVKNGCLDFNSEKVFIENLIIDDSVTFSSKLQEKTFKNIQVNSSGIFSLNYDEEIVINGDIHCDGSFNSSIGLIFFSDSIKKQTVKGTGEITIGKVKIKKDNQELNIQCDLNLIDTLSILSGNIELDSEMELYNSGFIYGESNQNSISGSGKIFTYQTIISGDYLNIKGLGINLTSATPLGATLIEREFQSYELTNQASINRVYNIEPTFNSNLNVSLSFNYWASELNNNQEETLKIQKSIDDGYSWSELESSLDTSINKIFLTGITNFSKWTAGSNNLITLAVDLISFQGERIENNIKLDWEVLSEIESKEYQINYSYDGITFDSLTSVSALNDQLYTTTWFDAPNENIFFELIEIENSGTVNHLDTIIVISNNDLEPKAWVSNNQIITKNFTTGTLLVYDSRGRLISVNNKEIKLLPPGVYHIELLNEISRWTFKFQK